MSGYDMLFLSGSSGPAPTNRICLWWRFVLARLVGCAWCLCVLFKRLGCASQRRITTFRTCLASPVPNRPLTASIQILRKACNITLLGVLCRGAYAGAGRKTHPEVPVACKHDRAHVCAGSAEAGLAD